MRHHRTLGSPGGARCVELECIVFEPDGHLGILGRKSVAPLAIIGDTRFPGVDADDGAYVDEIAADLAEHVGKAFADEQHLGLAIVDDVGDLGRRQPPVDRGHHRAKLGRGDQHLEIQRVVLAQISDAIALGDPQHGKALRRPVASRIELTEAQMLLAESESRGVGLDSRVVAHQIAQRFGKGSGGFDHKRGFIHGGRCTRRVRRGHWHIS